MRSLIGLVLSSGCTPQCKSSVLVTPPVSTEASPARTMSLLSDNEIVTGVHVALGTTVTRGTLRGERETGEHIDTLCDGTQVARANALHVAAHVVDHKTFWDRPSLPFV